MNPHFVPVTLNDDTGAAAIVAPELGAWLLSYSRPLPGHGVIDGIHHDPAVVARYPQGMYAGNPLLFPIASKNVVDGQDHRYRWEGRNFEMPQHGFARRMPWCVTDQSESSVTMELVDTPETRVNYPFAFRMLLTYRLEAGRLHWEQVVQNRSPGVLPFSTGFHPYIPLPLTPKGRRDTCFVNIPACRRHFWAGNYETFHAKPFPAVRWSVMTDVVDSLLLDGFPTPELALQDEASGVEVAVNFAGAPQHPFVVIWSRSTSEPCYCIEPWTALPNAFSRRETGELTLVPPGGEFRAAMHMDIRLMA